MTDARDVEWEARAILFESPNRPIFRSAEDADRAVRLVAAALQCREEELARLQSALTQKNGEPKWSRGFRVIDGKTCEIIEGVIAKADYDALKAQHEATVRELGLVKQNERLAIQALTEAQREIERLQDDIQKHKDDRSFWATKSHEQVLAKRAAEAQVRALREKLLEIERHCPCGARPESPHTHPHVGGCPVYEALALTTPPASQPS